MAQPRSMRLDALTLLSDDLLGEIFLRLPTLADVGRAATACAAFRRVVADRSFLLRLRSSHLAPLLGMLSLSSQPSFQPAKKPHGSAPCARALARAADFSFSFISSFRGVPVDVRDGRVLLRSCLDEGDFVVCDPLSRRYRLLPKIPQDPSSGLRRRCLVAFLVPARHEEAETTSFRVVCMEYRHPEQLVAFLISSTTAQWSRFAVDPSVPSICTMYSPFGYAYGCFDGGYGSGSCEQYFIIVEAGEGRIGMYTLHRSSRIISSPAVSYLAYAIREIDDEGNSKWQSEKTQTLWEQGTTTDCINQKNLVQLIGACSCTGFQGICTTLLCGSSRPT